MTIIGRFRILAGVAAAYAVLTIAGAGMFAPKAFAGDFWCRGECEAETLPHPIKRTFIRREEIELGRYEVVRKPALYGWIKKKVVVYDRHGSKPEYRTVKKRVLLRQYKNIAIYHRGRYEHVKERVEIYPEATDWSYFSSKD